MIVFTTVEEVLAAAGTELGTSDWLTVDQARVDAFADATGDHQWIHVDLARAATSTFGGTIAHGFLTLSLLPALGAGVYRFDTPGAVLNYGLDKVRFPAPLPVGRRVRTHVRMAAAEDTGAGVRATLVHTVEIEDHPRPACVAETLVLLVAQPA
ncbi:MaoC family dehydratase [Nocardioides bruguierae]|uniref:MaoC family dehydratase n=1 Tax=Nocardioides bruguierae TaxID=2945102 RepID=A0A9X2D8W4_9ACTN|nr:MaoC family dehydratase [Nocardioides bruguierae]MCL8025219.1 MaoC family dehydratase [Nocardioides bruguierae]MCM0621290.1 MaoC family dehydratase [Nocardioides bruguierae]